MEGTRARTFWVGVVLAAAVGWIATRCGGSQKPIVRYDPVDTPSSSHPSPTEAPTALSTTEMVPSARPAPEKRLLSFGWGAKEGQLGREKPTEGNPEGPMSFAVSKDGTYVLDQVNERVLLLDSSGKVKARFAASRTTQDIAVASDGTLALFDRHGKKSVALFEPNGRAIGELPLTGPGIAQTGSSTGVFIDGKDVYAEREHGALVRLGTIDGTAGDRKELSGRPSKDGTYLAGVFRSPDGRSFVYSAFDRAKNQLRFSRSHAPPSPVANLFLLDTDRAGHMMVGVQAADATGAPRSDGTVYCFDAQDGHLTGRATLHLSELPEESFKDAVVQDDGAIVFQVRDEEGVHFAQTRCSP